VIPPVGTKVSPGELATVAVKLSAASKAIHDALAAAYAEDPSMFDPTLHREAMFGPATDVADRYVGLLRSLQKHVDACVLRLAESAVVFVNGSKGFIDRDTAGGNGIGGN
jgi:hypothetical protein